MLFIRGRTAHQCRSSALSHHRAWRLDALASRRSEALWLGVRQLAVAWSRNSSASVCQRRALAMHLSSASRERETSTSRLPVPVNGHDLAGELTGSRYRVRAMAQTIHDRSPTKDLAGVRACTHGKRHVSAACPKGLPRVWRHKSPSAAGTGRLGVDECSVADVMEGDGQGDADPFDYHNRGIQ